VAREFATIATLSVIVLCRKQFISEMDPDLERLIDALLRQGADPAHSGADGATALSLAIQYRNADSVVDKLLDHGAVAQQIVHERSLVDIALHLSQAHMVEQLLLRGVGVKIR